MDKILIELGLKYYFGSPNVSEVNPFVILSVGKQFALPTISVVVIFWTNK